MDWAWHQEVPREAGGHLVTSLIHIQDTATDPACGRSTRGAAHAAAARGRAARRAHGEGRAGQRPAAPARLAGGGARQADRFLHLAACPPLPGDRPGSVFGRGRGGRDPPAGARAARPARPRRRSDRRAEAGGQLRRGCGLGARTRRVARGLPPRRAGGTDSRTGGVAGSGSFGAGRGRRHPARRWCAEHTGGGRRSRDPARSPASAHLRRLRGGWRPGNPSSWSTTTTRSRCGASSRPRIPTGSGGTTSRRARNGGGFGSGGSRWTREGGEDAGGRLMAGTSWAWFRCTLVAVDRPLCGGRPIADRPGRARWDPGAGRPPLAARHDQIPDPHRGVVQDRRPPVDHGPHLVSPRPRRFAEFRRHRCCPPPPAPAAAAVGAAGRPKRCSLLTSGDVIGVPVSAECESPLMDGGRPLPRRRPVGIAV